MFSCTLACLAIISVQNSTISLCRTAPYTNIFCEKLIFMPVIHLLEHWWVIKLGDTCAKDLPATNYQWLGKYGTRNEVERLAFGPFFNTWLMFWGVFSKTATPVTLSVHWFCWLHIPMFYGHIRFFKLCTELEKLGIKVGNTCNLPSFVQNCTVYHAEQHRKCRKTP